MSSNISGDDIDLEEIKATLEDSTGYPFELDIARRIEAEEEYIVIPNYSFEDQDTGIARELDFRAGGLEPISEKKRNIFFSSFRLL